MKIGDKVRALHEDIEGVVTKFLPNDLVEVEIEDGFEIPVQKGELVIVSAAEAEYFEQETQEIKASKPRIVDKIQKGLFLIFDPFHGEKLVKLNVYNSSSQDISLIGYENDSVSFKYSLSGVIQPGSFLEGSVFSLEAFNDWPNLVFQFTYLPKNADAMPISKVREFKLKASVFFKSKSEQTPLGKSGWCMQIDQGDISVNAQAIEESLNQVKPEEKFTSEKVKSIIDLHAEALGLELGLYNEEYINTQIKVFESSLDQAVVAGLNEVTFIHGVGNGKLQFEVQKRLSKHPNVSTYVDAQKEKFGYGATKAILK